MDSTLKKEIIQWDVKSWSKALDYWEKKIDWKTVNNALELGGHQGGLSLWLALKGKEVVCSDLQDVQKNAEGLHRKHHYSGKIIYQNIDASSIPYENHFDIIVFKSILGGIGRNDNYALQKKVIQEIYKALKPGGKLLFAENLQASKLHQAMRKKFINWGDSWRYLKKSEIHDLLQNFRHVDIKYTGMMGAFGRSEKQRSLLSISDQFFFNWLSPDSWKYIAYGIAEK